MGGLYRVSRIALRDRERVQHARAADLVAPDRLHAGNPALATFCLMVAERITAR